MPPPFNNACTGDCANWKYYDNEMYWTLVNGSTPDSWAKWQAPVSASGGMYEVFVYVPLGTNATSWQAPYTIHYLNNVAQTIALVDQYGLGNQWVSLGTYYMTSNDYIFTTDATGEGLGVHCGAGQYCRLGADTVKFVRRGTTYLPYLNTTDNWMSTVTIRNDGGGPAKMYLSLFDNAGSLRCSNFSDVASHAIQSFAVTAASCPPAKAAIVDASQDVVVVAREENGPELNEYNGILASGGSPGWEQAGSTVYAPVVKKANNSRSSRLLVMNAGTVATTAYAQYYLQSGQALGSPLAQALAVNGSTTFHPLECALCSAVIWSSNDQLLAVVIREQEDVSTNKRTTHNAFSAGATANWLPLVKKNLNPANGNTTRIAVQNVGSPETTVTLTCYPGNYACGTQTIPAKAVAMFVMADQTALPDGFSGAARAVSSGQPIVSVIIEAGGLNYKMSTNGVLVGSAVAYAPELYGGNCTQGGYAHWISTLSVQNMGSGDATITVTYHDSTGNLVGSPYVSPAISPNHRWAFNPTSGNMPDFCGSGVITSNQPVAAVVNNSHDASGDTKASYTVPNR